MKVGDHAAAGFTDPARDGVITNSTFGACPRRARASR